MFDKKRCIDNIYVLAKEHGLKIGDIEEKAGVSKGYLSRINKEENTSIPGIDLLASIADQFHVGIDYLVDCQLDTLTPNERFVLQFIDRLCKRTTEGKLEWIVEDEVILTAQNDKKVDNPLVEVRKIDVLGMNEPSATHGYASLIYAGDAYIEGDCYHCSVSCGKATIYLNAVKYDTNANTSNVIHNAEWSERVIEVYIYQNNVVKPVCSTYYLRTELKEAVENLFAAVASANTHINLDKSTKELITSILDEFDSLDVLPF